MSTENNTPSLEKMSFSRFQKHYTAYRQSEIPHRLIDLNDTQLELPDRSSLYTVRNFLTMALGDDGIYPDTSLPLIEHEDWRKFLHIETAALGPHDTPFPFTDRYTYMPGRFKGLVQAFFAKNKDFHNTLDDTSVDKAPNILACHEFSPLLSARFQGNMAVYRKFELVFRAILNKIVNTQFPRYHFIHVPLSDRLYTRADFVKTVLNIGNTTLKGNEDPSYYVLIHLIGFLFNEVASENNVKILPNDVGYLDITDESISKTNSLLNRLPTQLLDSVYFVFTHADRGIIYNLGDLRAFTTSTAFVDKVIKHINILKMVSDAETTPDKLLALNDSSFDVAVKAKQGVQEAPASNDTEDEVNLPDQVNVTADASPVEKKDVTAVVAATPVKAPIITPPAEGPPSPEAPNAHFTKVVKTELAKTVSVAQAQSTTSVDAPAKRAKTLYDKHLQVRIGDRTIAEHLAEPDPQIESNNLDFLGDVVPDKSMTKSTIANLDSLYIKHMAVRDIAKVMTSLVQHGYFVSDVKEQLEMDQFTRKVHYRIKLIDIQGKQHSINFSLPHVDENGFILVNGVVSRMVKQNVNLPICKVAEDRVNLSSNYNKTLVTRIGTKANSFDPFINKYLIALMKAGKLTVEYGKLKVGNRLLPYEYTTIAQRYLELTFGDYQFNLAYDERFNALTEGQTKQLSDMEAKYGTYCGTGPRKSLLFWDQSDVIHQVGPDGNQMLSFHLLGLLHHLFSNDVDTPSMLSEWTELKILNLTIPVVLVLGFQYGLKNTLDYIKLDYTFVPKGQRIPYRFDQIRVKFADGVLVFSRYPLAKSLVASGLNKWDLSAYSFMEFDAPDAYYALFSQRGISQNYLRGISAFFDFFVDPITMDILQHMHEPTNVRDLLLRATEMLSTMDHRQASAMANHRMRGYERMASTLYNEVTRSLSQWRERRNQKNGFSINPEAVFLRVMADASVINTEILNPIHEMKGNAHVTYSGSGGRTSQSFVVQDRVYANDAVGILSEATPDSGKVAMTTYTSANPRLQNIRGMVDANEDGTPLDPSNMLSTASMLIPGLTQDDGKRASFCSIQLSHHVPCPNYSVGHVRTGFEKVIAHRVSDNFAVSAIADGKVTDVDEENGLLTIEYDPIPILPSGTMSVPYKKQALQLTLEHNGTIRVVIGASELPSYPLGKILSLAPDINGKVIASDEGLDVNSIPPEVMKTRPDLLQKIKAGTESTLVLLTLKVLGKTYPAEKGVYKYGERFTPVSGSYMSQNLVLNVTPGERVKRGDIVIYNAGFFSADRGTKQVSWNHGIMATIALIETSETLEDGSVISKSLGERLTMSPSHKRSITLLNTSVIKQMVDEGAHVETIDPLITFIERDLDILTNARGSEDSLAFLTDLEKKSPKANYHGRVADIALYYSCPFDKLSPSLQALAKKIDRKHRKIAMGMKGTANESKYQYTPQVPVGMKYHGVEFMEDTVLIEFTISESIVCGVGDKCVLGAANKTVVSSVMEEQYYTKSGIPVDGMYGCVSGYARIVNSMYIMGIGNRFMGGLQKLVTDEYFS